MSPALLSGAGSEEVFAAAKREVDEPNRAGTMQMYFALACGLQGGQKEGS